MRSHFRSLARGLIVAAIASQLAGCASPAASREEASERAIMVEEAPAGCVTIETTPAPAAGGLTIPRQLVCPISSATAETPRREP